MATQLPNPSTWFAGFVNAAALKTNLIDKLNAWATELSGLTDPRTFTALSGFASGYGANSAGYAPAYYIGADDHIELRGQIGKTSGSFVTGQTVLISNALPSAIRPAQNVDCAAAISNGAANGTTARISITLAGTLTVYMPSAGATWVSLDGIAYDLA